MGKIRGRHSSPGFYSKITDLSYAANTLGITTAGLVGETLKGPAFEPVLVRGWDEYQTYFGGTSPEIFKGTKYPKYELPYIAKSYLKKSDQLYVCRVLGLSGYNAGTAYLITAQKEKDSKKYVVAVLRANGKYKKYGVKGDICNGGTVEYDTLETFADGIKLEPYTSRYMEMKCSGITSNTSKELKITSTVSNLGQFTLVAKKGDTEVARCSVSLNPNSKDYILNVIGSKPNESNFPFYVEELYDNFLIDLVKRGDVDIISSAVTENGGKDIVVINDPVSDVVTIPTSELKKQHFGMMFICGKEDSNFKYAYVDDNGDMDTSKMLQMTLGCLYKVVSYTDSLGMIKYTYVPILYDNLDDDDIRQFKKATTDEINDKKIVKYILKGDMYESVGTEPTTATDKLFVKNKYKQVTDVESDTPNVVKILSKNDFYGLSKDGLEAVYDIANYNEMFRCAVTPWFVSELKGDAKNVEVKKLFRFHTISDGADSNTMYKISISNVNLTDGTFDIQVRDFNDTDAGPVILESYRGLNMIPGNSKYIGLQFGTIDGVYERKSKHVLVEVIDNEMTRECVPCGFIGYPVRKYTGAESPTFTYNTVFDEDINVRKQYFGLSDITGIDIDMLSYKGKNAYSNDYREGYTKPFHLDSSINGDLIKDMVVTIDGDEKSKELVWETVTPQYDTLSYSSNPIIGEDYEMQGTLFEDIKTRKFTACFYGGFDGWDIYRDSRTNTDEFKANKYKGQMINGYSKTFSRISDPISLSLSGNCITSDYYAYLAAINQFEMPDNIVINLFATPGIDLVNNTSLVNEVIDMLTEKRQDALYIPTNPDKPSGASDARDEMFSSQEASNNLRDTGIDTYYATTYYPWVNYFDKDNSIYLNLPATKDALRNMADVDNKKYPWIAAAGLERGDVECRKMHFFAKLEDEDNLYDGRINPLKTFSEDGVKIWGNKTLYTGDTPMNRINVVRLVLYLRKLIRIASLKLVFEQNDATLKDDFEKIIRPILTDVKKDRGITDFRLKTSQTPEQMDAHEISAKLSIKPTPTLEYIELEFEVTPQGVDFRE